MAFFWMAEPGLLSGRNFGVRCRGSPYGRPPVDLFVNKTQMPNNCIFDKIKIQNMERLKIIPTSQFSKYDKEQKLTLLKHFNKIKRKNIDFGYVRKSSAVYSSMIEGNVIDLETYFKYFNSGMNTKTKSFKEISDLEDAYVYAQDHVINQKNVLHTHKLLTKSSAIEKKYRGAYRDKNVSVMKNGNKIVYSGADAKIVNDEMQKLFNDISILRKRKLSISQVFYYASLIHLIFVAIHPFADGNGRTARLIEKWFLVNNLGKDAWSINSEKLYLHRSQLYHKNINKVGSSYKTIDYDYSISFLKMLPMALKIK